MNYIKHFMLTVLVALVSCMSASAYDFEVDGIYYNVVSRDDLTCEVTYEKYENFSYHSPYSGDVTIPTTVEFRGRTLTVTKIGYRAFEKCTSLTSVVIPKSVTEIGTYAFASCM